MNATVVTDNTLGQVSTLARKAGAQSWASVKRLAARSQRALDTFERRRLDPLLDRALALWGDRRAVQQQQVGANTLLNTLTAEDRHLNRGFYLCAGSFGIAVVGRLLYPPLQLLSLPGLLYGTWQLYHQAYTTLVDERRLDVNVLMALVNTAYIGGGYWILGNFTNTSYFFSTRLIKAVKERLQEDLISALINHPRLVWTLVGGHEVQRHLDELQAGDLVIVHAGEVLPVDGIICEGVATLDEHMLTGEARPVEKSIGDRVFTATLLLAGKLHITIEQAGAETMVARIGTVLAQTVDFRSTRQLQVEQLTDRLVAPILGVAAITWPFFGFSAAAAVVSQHPYRELNVFGSLGILNAFVLAAGQGLLIKDGRTFELLQQVDTLVFDKTGTLTQAEPQVIAIHCVDGVGDEQLLAFAAAAEQHQSHPIARAILAKARAHGVTTPWIDEATLKVGLGLVVTIAGQTILVGSTRFMDLHAITIPAQFARLQEKSQQLGHLLVWVAHAGIMIGAIELEIALRPEARAVVAALRQRAHIRTIMIVSGDHAIPTEQAALAIGADGWYAETLPTGKAELLARLQAVGRKVCFIGDGINDAIALKQAHVSVSMRGATSAALDTAHVVLMDGSLTQLPILFELAERTERNQRTMMLPVLGTSVLGLVGIYSWGWGLTAATILDQLSTIGGATLIMRQRLLPD